MNNRLKGRFYVPMPEGSLEGDGADQALVRRVSTLLEEVPQEQRGKAVRLAREMVKNLEQRRRALEDLVALEFSKLPDLACGRSLVLFDYGSNDGHVAYKTSLDRGVFVETLRVLVKSWRDKTSRVSEKALLPTDREMITLLGGIAKELPKEIGAALIFGKGEECQYIGLADRDDMADLFEELAAKLENSDESQLAARVLKDWHCPFGKPRTAAARELYAMNVAHAWSVLGWDDDRNTERSIEWTDKIARIAEGDERFRALLGHVIAEFFGEQEPRTNDDISAFLDRWRLASFARLEVGHKLAAALCLTDVPEDVTVQAPWDAWSLVIPDGIFPQKSEETSNARAWVIGADPQFLVSVDGGIWRPTGELTDVRWVALRNLIRGACLALSNPEEFRKERQHAPTARAASKKRRSGPPDLEQARYLLSAPVKVDLREHLAGVLSGRGGTSPTVQFLVRGHWRNQSYGPRHSLRRVQWIEPFWKGPEDARVLLRQHRVEMPKEAKPPC